MLFCDREAAFFFDEAQNWFANDLLRSIVNSRDGEGFRGKCFAAIRVSNDVIESDGAVEVGIWSEGVTGFWSTGNGACVGGEAFYREGRGEGFNVREAREEICG